MQFQIHNHHQECNEKTKIWDFSQNNFFFFDIFSVEVSLAFVIWTWLNFLNVFTKFQWWILGESTFDIIIFTITTTFNLFIKKIVSDHGREKFPKRLRRSCYQNHSQGLRAPSHHAHGHSLQGGGAFSLDVRNRLKRLRHVTWEDTRGEAYTDLDCQWNRLGRLLLILQLFCRYNHEVLGNMSGAYDQMHTFFIYVKRL